MDEQDLRDKRAFTDFVKRHETELHNFIRQRLKVRVVRANAEDVTLNSISQFWIAITDGTYKPQGYPKGYLFAIARNLIESLCRSPENHKRVLGDIETFEPSKQPTHVEEAVLKCDPGFEEVVSITKVGFTETIERVRAALSRLSAEERSILGPILAGFPLPIIAKALRLKPSTANMRYTRAIPKLQVLLGVTVESSDAANIDDGLEKR